MRDVTRSTISRGWKMREILLWKAKNNFSCYQSCLRLSILIISRIFWYRVVQPLSSHVHVLPALFNKTSIPLDQLDEMWLHIRNPGKPAALSLPMTALRKGPFTLCAYMREHAQIHCGPVHCELWTSWTSWKPELPTVGKLHCVPIKTTTFYFMNNSVKNEVTWVICCYTESLRNYTHVLYSKSTTAEKMLPALYLVKCRSYATNQISIASIKYWMHFK